MVLPTELTKKGFSLESVTTADLQDYIRVKTICYKKYIDAEPKFFGEWNEGALVNDFNVKMNQSFNKKLLLHTEVVGFLSYDTNTKKDKIDGVSISFIEKARNNGIGSIYLAHIIKCSQDQHKSIFLQVMKTNPAQNLYARFGFKICEDIEGMWVMVYNPQGILK